MRKILALLLTLAMLFSLAACGGGDDDKTPSSEDNQPSSQQQEQNTPDPGTDEPDNSGEATPEISLPDGVDLPVDKYPWMEGLVLPDDTVITSIDDEYYESDGNVKLVVKPMDSDKLPAYLEKLEASGYTKDVAGWINPDVQFDLNIQDWSSMGYDPQHYEK